MHKVKMKKGNVGEICCKWSVCYSNETIKAKDLCLERKSKKRKLMKNVSLK